MGNRACGVERIVIQALLEDEVIEVGPFCEARGMNKHTLGTVISCLSGEDLVSSERVIGKNTRTGGTTTLRYRAKNKKLLRARLSEISGPPNYDFETLNWAMGFGQVLDLKCPCSFRLSVMEAKEEKDPTEVDYIPKYPK